MHRLWALAWAAATMCAGVEQPAVAQSEAPLPPVALTDSDATALAGTRRVAITSVIVAFQASTGAEAGARFFVPVLTSRDKVQSMMALEDINLDLLDVIAAAAKTDLAAELRQAGFEVVPEAEISASSNYKAILAQAGYANHSRYANAMGDVMLVGAPGLEPYTAYQGELGSFSYPSTTYLAWISGMGGASTTAGGPSIRKQGDAWKVPGLEVALAKELNAHVVKAFYVVSLGKTEAKRSTGFSVSQQSGLFTDSSGSLHSGSWQQLDRTVTGSGKAFAQVGLVADQSHIAFRTQTGNAKWQKVSMLKMVPPKDGDVVVRITEPVVGGTDFFDVRQGEFHQEGGMIFSAQKRGDINLAFNVTIADEAGYGKEVTGMIAAANHAMLTLTPAR